MGGNSLKTFEDLKCWQACREVRIFIMNLVKSYPREEKYSIVDNMKRAARSTRKTLRRDSDDFITEKICNFVASAVVPCLNLLMI